MVRLTLLVAHHLHPPLAPLLHFFPQSLKARKLQDQAWHQFQECDHQFQKPACQFQECDHKCHLKRHPNHLVDQCGWHPLTWLLRVQGCLLEQVCLQDQVWLLDQA
mmetsp:Transcript_16596/g.32395  ORF Transcript_16596/g.32395 Transcript_16596/m.32395 type:complete len:106 (+) Transcript_16596:52-369(+)